MDTTTFWTTVGLIAAALLVTTPLADRAMAGDRASTSAMPLTGIVAVLSFTIDAGAVAALMTVPWLGLAALLLASDLRSRSLRHRPRRLDTLVVHPEVTWGWMLAGACWLTAHRLGTEPLGFDRSIALLTVAHFHVAGLGLTALLVATYRRRPTRPLLGAIWLHQFGMLSVAAGLTFSDHLEVAGATVITVALGIWTGAVVRWIRTPVTGPARLLLAVAAVAWMLPMALALGWALGPFLPSPVVTTFATMLRFHAVLQTFGLVACGLAGLILASPADSNHAPTVLTTDPKHPEANDAVAQPSRS